MPRTAALLLALAAVPVAAQVPAANAFSDRLAALPLLQRTAVLRRAVLDSGVVCKRVLGGRFQQSYRNLKMWTVNCAGGLDYGLFIGPDASVQVRPCGDLVKLKLPVCRPMR